jgi:hypothetical protein
LANKKKKLPVAPSPARGKGFPVSITPSNKKSVTLRTPEDGSILWSFSMLDHGHPKWCFAHSNPDKIAEVLLKLGQIERLLETERRQGGSHPVTKDILIKAAQDRLSELMFDDIDEMYSVRVTGKERIYTIRHGQVFHIIWFDKDHEICPSRKKHT